MWGSTRFSCRTPNFLVYISIISVMSHIYYSLLNLQMNLFYQGDNLKTSIESLNLGLMKISNRQLKGKLSSRFCKYKEGRNMFQFLFMELKKVSEFRFVRVIMDKKMS